MKPFLVTLVAGLVALSVSSGGARANPIALPTTLDQLAVPPAAAGNYVVNSTGLTFSSFTFSVSAIPPSTPVLDASGVNVTNFAAGSESGLEFSGAMFAPAGTTVDYKISYIVTAAPGIFITDAVLGTMYDFPIGTTGLASIGQSLFDSGTAAAIGSLQVSNTSGTTTDVVTFAPVASILVMQDIFLMSGNLGVGVSMVRQGFSTTAMPEPGSMALLGIGLSALAGTCLGTRVPRTSTLRGRDRKERRRWHWPRISTPA